MLASFVSSHSFFTVDFSSFVVDVQLLMYQQHLHPKLTVQVIAMSCELQPVEL